MSQSATFATGTTERMKELLGSAETAIELRRIQAVLLGSLGMSAEEISIFVGYNAHYIRHFWSRFRAEGEASLEANKGVGNRALISIEEEKEFLEPFFEQAKKGGILIVKEIHKAYEKQFRRRIHHSVIYNLLHRHGWRKIIPRPVHPKGNPTDQEIFKGSFPPPRLARQS